MASTLGQRLAPFLDVLGAVLIFGSWFVSNALLQQAQSRTSAHQAIIERVRNFRLYEDFAGRTRGIQVELDRTSELVRTSLQLEPRAEAPRWSGMTATQVRQLGDFADDLEGYARKSSESASVTGPFAAMREGVDRLSTDFGSARDEYERIVAQIESSGASGRDAAAEEALQGRVDGLWKEYDAAKKAMLQTGDERLESAAVQAASAGLMASRSKRISYVLYALGTLIILYGRARKSLGAKEKSAA